MDAVFNIVQAGPSVSIQDEGRRGYKRYGVTESGPMDRVGFALSQVALGSGEVRPVVEISLGGLTLECTEGEVTAAVTGGAFKVIVDNKTMPPWSVFTLSAGSTLQIRPGLWGSWCYLGFAGDIACDKWLGSKSVHLKSGLCGLPFVQGDTLRVLSPSVLEDYHGEVLDPELVKPVHDLRLVLGPQDRFFDEESIEKLCNSEFQLTAEYNRMGVRLSGATLNINAALDMPSEPIARGSLQVPGHGDPICLLADHQPTGGYPKIATVISVDQDQLVQLRSGEKVRFTQTDSVEAIRLARQQHTKIDGLRKRLKEGRTGMTQRLWMNNLISGVAGLPED